MTEYIMEGGVMVPLEESASRILKQIYSGKDDREVADLTRIANISRDPAALRKARARADRAIRIIDATLSDESFFRKFMSGFQNPIRLAKMDREERITRAATSYNAVRQFRNRSDDAKKRLRAHRAKMVEIRSRIDRRLKELEEKEG